MSYTNGLDKPDDYFNTKLYTGNGTDAHAITGVGFSPDFVWLKGRSVAEHHTLNDTVRGANKQLFSNLIYGESTETDRLQSFDSDGFTLGTDVIVNQSSQTFVSWNWKANGTAHQTQMEVSQAQFQLILQVDLVLCLIQEQEVHLRLVMDYLVHLKFILLKIELTQEIGNLTMNH
jgi:hypothetical protein